MTPADVLLERRRRWSQYVTQPPTPRAQATTAPTAAGTSTPAVMLRGTEGFRQDLASVVDLLLDEAARHRRAIDELRAHPTPVPLMGYDEIEDSVNELSRNLAHLQAYVVALREQVTGEGGHHERLVAVEYAASRDPHAREGWLTGLTVVGALVASTGALVSVGALVWTWGGGA